MDHPQWDCFHGHNGMVPDEIVSIVSREIRTCRVVLFIIVHLLSDAMQLHLIVKLSDCTPQCRGPSAVCKVRQDFSADTIYIRVAAGSFVTENIIYSDQ